MKKPSLRLPLRALGAALLIGASSSAAVAATSDACDLSVASGPAGKVYEQIVRDMRAVCGNVVSMCTLNTKGGVQNLQMLSSNEAELGLVQIDLLHKLKDSDENIGALKAVMPLHANLLHVVTLTEGSMVDVMLVPGTRTKVPYSGRKVVLGRFSDLRGMTVALVGSADLTAQVLNERLQYGLRLVSAATDEAALAMLKSGEVQAVFTLAGWPMPALVTQPSGSGLQLAEFDVEPWEPYKTTRRNYQNLGALNLKMLAVPNLLVSRQFKAGGTQGQRVSSLQTCLIQKLDELREGRYHPIWKEIKDTADTHGWPRWVAEPAATQKSVRK